MAITNFIPQIWDAQMLENFHQQVIAAGLVNRQYEGDATSGNTVHITGLTDIAVTDYKAAGRITTAGAVSDTRVDLLIDQEKAFDFFIDDIDRAQAAGSMEAYTRSAAYGLAADADKFILSNAVTNAGTKTTGDGAVAPATPAALTTPDQFFNVVRDLRKTLNKNLVPQGNRVLLVNAEFEAVMLAAASKLTNADVSGTTEGLRNASLGNLLGFSVYTSEHLPTTAKAQALAFHQSSIAYVSQVEKTEAMRAQDKFADRLRGLHVYGGKVVRPAGVAAWTNA